MSERKIKIVKSEDLKKLKENEPKTQIDTEKIGGDFRPKRRIDTKEDFKPKGRFDSKEDFKPTSRFKKRDDFKPKPSFKSKEESKSKERFKSKEEFKPKGRFKQGEKREFKPTFESKSEDKDKARARPKRAVREQRKAEQQERWEEKSGMSSPSRTAAFDILQRVENENAYSSVLLAHLDESLKKEDRALCHEIVLGVLRNQIFLDELIGYYSTGKGEKLEKPVRLALRIGLYQLRFLTRVPPFAVVNDSVNLVHRARLHIASKLANAVLRSYLREPLADFRKFIKNELRRRAIEYSHPFWLFERWSKNYGRDEALNILRANNQHAPVSFRFTNKEVDKEEVIAKLKDSVKLSEIAPNGWRLKSSNEYLQTLSSEGKIYFQDEASQLLAHVLEAKEGDSVLDLCAAPGSKTTHIATLQPELKRLTACDIHEHRLQIVQELTSKTGVENLETRLVDATEELPFKDGEFDRVLVDAPCSGTGTLRRNPEIRYRITADDILILADKQKRILKNAARVVDGGGRLVYSTCSLEREENEDVVGWFLNEEKDFRLVRASVKESLLNSDGTARILPQKYGTDGFFIAVFERLRD